MDRRQERKDLAYRRKAVRAIVLTVVVGVAMLVAFNAWLGYLATQDSGQVLRALALAALCIRIGMATVALLLGRVLLDWSRQTREQGQWPPAGMQRIGNPPARHGEEAARIARRLKFAGVVSLGFAAALVVWTAWRVLA